MGDKQASDLIILDLRSVSIVADYFVIGTVESPRQFKAVLASVSDAVKREADIKPRTTEGAPESGWVLMDVGDVIVHVFDPQRRAYYALEELWDEAPLVARMP
jgi:ribosome-associated protein